MNSDTEAALPTVEPSDRLVIDSDTDKNITVALYEYEERQHPGTIEENPEKWEIVDSVTYENRGGTIRVTEIPLHGHAVVSVAGEKRWEGPVSGAYHVELLVDQDGQVTVVERTAV